MYTTLWGRGMGLARTDQNFPVSPVLHCLSYVCACVFTPQRRDNLRAGYDNLRGGYDGSGCQKSKKYAECVLIRPDLVQMPPKNAKKDDEAEQVRKSS
jgi:hypothetical protein